MKKNFSLIVIIVAIANITSSILFSCSSMEEDYTSYPLRLNAAIEDTVNLPGDAFSNENPCHVVAFVREKACTPFYFLFEEDAYLGGDGQLKWNGKFRYWPGGYCKFIAYWPADANVVIDETGNIISANCTMIAVSEPYCHFSENPTLTFHSYEEEDWSLTKHTSEL